MAARYRCYACEAAFEVTEHPESSWGLVPTPLECPDCGASVEVRRPPNESSARWLVSAVVGFKMPVQPNRTPREILRDACITPSQVGHVLRAVELIDWNDWHQTLREATAGRWGRDAAVAQLARWPEAIRMRDSGEISRTLEQAGAEVRLELAALAKTARKR